MSRLLPALILATLPSTVLAEPPFVLSYDQFEMTLEHADLAVCPEPLAAPDRFCRLTIANDELHVFAFADTAEGQPLVAVQSWSTDLLEGLLD